MISVFTLRRRAPVAVVVFLGLIVAYYLVSTNKISASLNYSNNGISGITDNLLESILSGPTMERASPHYRHLIGKFGVDFASKFSLDERCEIYFAELYDKSPNWKSPNINDLPHNAGTFHKDEYMERKKNEKLEEKKQSEKIGKHESLSLTPEEISSIETEYNSMLSQTKETEDLMVESMTHFRVFDRCYLQINEHSLDFVKMVQSLKSSVKSVQKTIGKLWKSTDTKNKRDGFIDMCADTESRLFPWFSKQMPVFTRWDGYNMFDIPDMQSINALNGIKVAPKEKFVQLNKHCFLQYWKQAINGRGIVISANDSHLKDLSALLSILRVLGNKLPIQIVHKGDLSKEVMAKLVKVARDDELPRSPGTAFLKNVTLSLKNYGVPVEALEKQELWFVNVMNCIKGDHMHKFDSYSNKYLALLFNSFDEMLLMDNDAVPFVDPNAFFESKGYQETEAFFFQDRLNNANLFPQDVKVFEKLMPSIIDTVLFNVPKVSNKTMEIRFFKHHYKHVLESGIFAYRRSAHFSGMLAATQLDSWEPVSSKTWGDKETYWLGLSVMGDERYYINELGAGAIASEDDFVKVGENGQKMMKACSVQPAHVSSEDKKTLLWINSGFRVCKKESWGTDIKMTKYKKLFGTDTEALKNYFHEPLNITGVVIPPAQESISSDRTKTGWRMVSECFGYKYCAMDKFSDNDNAVHGTYVEFNETQRDVYRYFGHVWAANYDAE